MKKVINRKCYDTEKARHIASWCNTPDIGDFRHMEESLYCSPKGQYFIAGSGGPMSSYARSCGSNETCGSSDIRLVTKDEAIDWLESHNMVEELEAEFGSELQEG